jgi:hypothetical protein
MGMSFDIFLNSFENGKPSSFGLSVLKDAFGPDAEFDNDASRVRFPDGSGGDIYGADEPQIDSLMFNHCGGDPFFKGMLTLANMTNGLIFWPSVPLTAVAPSETALAHIDPEFLIAFEQVKIARTIEELGEYIRNS